MAYSLHQLAPGSYDLVLDGKTIGSVVQQVLPGGDLKAWWAELLEQDAGSPKPAPFVEVEHRFDTLGELMTWLGEPEVIRLPRGPIRSSW